MGQVRLRLTSVRSINQLGGRGRGPVGLPWGQHTPSSHIMKYGHAGTACERTSFLLEQRMALSTIAGIDMFSPHLRARKAWLLLCSSP